MWWIPTLISVVCIAGGAGAASRWLPDLETGPVGGLAFFAVCGLLGGALDVVGLHIYLIVNGLAGFGGPGPILASELDQTLIEAGILFGLAALVYLVAARRSSQPS
jgi:hypothetical protein